MKENFYLSHGRTMDFMSRFSVPLTVYQTLLFVQKKVGGFPIQSALFVVV